MDQQFVLTRSRKLTTESLLEILNSRSNDNMIVLLVGLPGVGKTMAIDYLQPQVIACGGRVIDSGQIIYLQNTKRKIRKFRRENPGPLVATVTPHEAVKLSQTSQELLPDFVIKTVTLCGLDKQETEDWLHKLKAQCDLSVPLHIFAELTLGVPLLIEQLLSPGLGEEEMLRIMAKYVIISQIYDVQSKTFFPDLHDYLQIRLTTQMQTMVQEIRQDFWQVNHIYNNLHRCLLHQKELSRRGHAEPSPLFVCRQSLEIYNGIFRPANKKRNGLEVFVPQISQADLQRLITSLGITVFPNSLVVYNDGPRLRIIGCDYRKVSMWLKDQEGTEYLCSHEFKDLPRTAAKYLRAYQAGKFKQSPIRRGAGNYFLIHAHDHEDMLINPQRIGWMMESYLQQTGLFYVTNNFQANLLYTYDPEKKTINILGAASMAYWPF